MPLPRDVRRRLALLELAARRADVDAVRDDLDFAAMETGGGRLRRAPGTRGDVGHTDSCE